jgi:hypothetical protein
MTGGESKVSVDGATVAEIIAALEPTLGGINLEDIKAPECFAIERALRDRLNIPVFHDDQHGTAIISAAALLNGLELVGKAIGDIKLVSSGAGAAVTSSLSFSSAATFWLMCFEGYNSAKSWFTSSRSDKFEMRLELGLDLGLGLEASAASAGALSSG